MNLTTRATADQGGQQATPAGSSADDSRAELLIRYLGDFAPVVIESAKGSWLRTRDGAAVLDFASGQICSTLGHRHPRVVNALHEALDTLMHLDSKMLSEPVLDLADRLAHSLPEGLNRSIFLNTGAEANEVAVKLAKMFTGNFEVVGVARSFHGVTTGTASYTFLPARRGYGPLLPGAHAVPAPYAYRCPIRHCAGKCDMACLESGFDQVQQTAVASPAAFIVEPVLSSGGIIVPPDGYLSRAKELCEEHGTLLIVDESQTGLGRLGTCYGFQHDGVVPDIVVLSKTLGGGMPLSATVTTSDIEQRCADNGFSHITSHVSDPLPAVAGLAVLDVVEEERLEERAAGMGDYLMTALHQLENKYDCVGDVRGRGLLVGLEFVVSKQDPVPAEGMAARVAARCLERGLSLHAIPTGKKAHCFRIAPPLTVSKDDIDFAVGVIDDAIAEVCQRP
ncbi:MAG: aminotransferase class III-fold pyridoxal phosphate-dependent enzyme [Pseudonocardiaceae bacterium]|nr:aminotransferase class III-fold pyridoxal phosphate-dependent enzyme [Pseudonocardiaceae bacterium]